MSRLRAVPLALLLCGCTAPVDQLPVCNPDPKAQGEQAFADQSGRREGTSEVHLRFALLRRSDERFTATPQVTSTAGRVLDARTVGNELQVELLMAGDGAWQFEVRLRGSISGEFAGDVDRCPFEETFFVSVDETSVFVGRGAGR